MDNKEIREIDESLSLNEKIFIAEYIANGFIAARAYFVAYPKANTNNSDRLMKRPKVRAAIRDAMRERLGDLDDLGTKTLLKLDQIAFAEKGDPDYQAASQLKALDLIQKQLGLQKQNLKAEVNNKAAIEITILGDNEDEDENDSES